MNSPSETLRATLREIIAGWDGAILYDDDELIWSAGMWTYDGGKAAYSKEEMERRIDQILSALLNKLPEKEDIEYWEKKYLAGSIGWQKFEWAKTKNDTLDTVRQILEGK